MSEERAQILLSSFGASRWLTCRAPCSANLGSETWWVEQSPSSRVTLAPNKFHQPWLGNVSARQSSAWWCQQRNATMTRNFCHCHRLSQFWRHFLVKHNSEWSGVPGGNTPFPHLVRPLGNQREAVVLQHCALCWLTFLPSHWRTHSITVPNPGLSLVNTASNNLGPAQQLATVHFGNPRFRIQNPQ